MQLSAGMQRPPTFTTAQIQGDLRAFERRITKAVQYLEPKSYRWRILLFLSIMFVLLSGYSFITNIQLDKDFSVALALYENKIFALALFFLGLLVFTGAHKRANTSAIILARNRQVLLEYNLSCNEKGKLIIKPSKDKDV